TTVSGSGASADLSFAGSYGGLRDDLLAWDHGNGDALGFAASAADGVQPKQGSGFNVEGMEFGRGGSATAYLGFRAPQVPPGARHDALVVPVTNLLDLLSGGATHATFGAPLEWDLGGLGVREIRRSGADRYLVIAGAADEGGAQRLYTWDGDPAHQPVPAGGDLPSGGLDGAWEAIVRVPDALGDGSAVQLVEDNGDSVWYGGSTVGKDLAAGLEKDWTDTASLRLPGQAVAFGPTPPSPAYAGTTYAPSASGGASGQPVAFSIDPSSGAGVCSAAGGVVSLLRAGRCVIAADQAGTFQYAAAARVTQTVQVTQIASAALCTLTDKDVQGSAAYRRLGPIARIVVDALVTSECRLLTGLAPKLPAAQKQALIAAYGQGVASLASGGWLTAAQAAGLRALAATL
ncbi:MAG TPA: hypothetical protein VFV85_04565, partial [Conexibacter sp.]|nr:hypothetical protein [Conexibacter sp.]